MSVQISSTPCSIAELATELATAYTAGARIAMMSAEDWPESGVLRIVYLLHQPNDVAPKELTIDIDRQRGQLPSMAHLDFSIGRFEREIADQFGVILQDHPQPARLVKHAHWPDDYYPLLRGAPSSPGTLIDERDYPFVEVKGEEVYEIGVGPIHAGIIEPGHFRFSAVGEAIITMKARLWFVHRGIEKLFEGMPIAAAISLAEKVSGDTSVGHALAMATAIEDALGLVIDPETHLIRQILLDMEQVHNLVNDIGAIANDTALSTINAFTGVQRELALRENKRITGHRLLRGAIGIGSAALREPPNPDFFRQLGDEMADIIHILTSHVMAVDRFRGTGSLSTDDAKAIGCVGYVAHASGVPPETTSAHGSPYQWTHFGSSEYQATGDVNARLEVRIAQLQNVLPALMHAAEALSGTTSRHSQVRFPTINGPSTGVACLESWRGRLTHRVVITENRIRRAKIVDPSFFNWPAVSISLRGALIADFPLINKSFNLSYAGNDL